MYSLIVSWKLNDYLAYLYIYINNEKNQKQNSTRTNNTRWN